MAKNQGIKYNFSGKWDAVSNVLRQFSVADALKRINKESIALFYNNSNSDIRGTKRVKFNLFHKGNPFPEQHEVMIMAWALIDLAYYLIKTSNDFRGKKIEYDAELYILQEAVDNYKERNEHDFLENQDEQKIDFFMYLWGFAGEQFKTESPAIVLDNQSRDLYILFEINDPSEFNIEESLSAETGLTWQMIIAYLTLAWVEFTQVDTLDEVNKRIGWKNPDNEKEFVNLLERYTADYQCVRESQMGRQILYAKPYIRTQKGEVVSVSAYLNYFLCEHSVLWIVRDRFKNLDRQDFVNYFGNMFEKYFAELLGCTLDKNEYEKIPEEKEKRADWKICCGKHKILVEQKSAIMRLSAKQQETDVSAIKSFAVKTVIKAMRQLERTENDFGAGKYIKIILLYEDYLKPEILEQIMDMPECDVENDNYYWLVTISEMERLLTVAKNDRKKFDDIICDKVDRELHHSLAGKSLDQLLDEHGVTDNEYIRQEKFMKYRNAAQDAARSFL